MHTVLVHSIVQTSIQSLEDARDRALLDAQVQTGEARAEAENAAERARLALDSLYLALSMGDTVMVKHTTTETREVIIRTGGIFDTPVPSGMELMEEW